MIPDAALLRANLRLGRLRGFIYGFIGK